MGDSKYNAFSIVLSAIIGSLEALEQTKIKRFIAFTIIYNNAFFLSALLISTKDGYNSLIESLLIYIILSLLTVLIFSVQKTSSFSSLQNLRDL